MQSFEPIFFQILTKGLGDTGLPKWHFCTSLLLQKCELVC